LPLDQTSSAARLQPSVEIPHLLGFQTSFYFSLGSFFGYVFCFDFGDMFGFGFC
jgi:hypothetical protein